MWKILLVLLGHRFLLLVVSIIAINHHLHKIEPSAKFFQMAPFTQIKNAFISVLEQQPEVSALHRLDSFDFTPDSSFAWEQSQSPFLLSAYLLQKSTLISPLAALLIVANLFFILLLWEYFRLSSYFVTTDTAILSTSLLILWPPSYELNLGSPLVLTALFVLIAMRQALDNRWWMVGTSMFVLVFCDSLFPLLLLPLLYFFWYFQRHFALSLVIRRTLFFLLPIFAATYLRYGLSVPPLPHFSTSALGALYSTIIYSDWASLFRPELSGQWTAMILFGLGALSVVFMNIPSVYRIIPISLFIITVLYSGLVGVASRLTLASPCLIGIASVASQTLYRVLALILLLLGAYDVFRVLG